MKSTDYLIIIGVAVLLAVISVVVVHLLGFKHPAPVGGAAGAMGALIAMRMVRRNRQSKQMES